jgi:hypothetical protein
MGLIDSHESVPRTGRVLSGIADRAELSGLICLAFWTYRSASAALMADVCLQQHRVRTRGHIDTGNQTVRVVKLPGLEPNASEN